MTASNADKVVEKFRKIMGPVAITLAKEAAQEVGGSAAGEKLILKDAAQLDKFKRNFAQKCGKIIGDKLAETLLRE
jgi:hypothetical protein